VRAWRSRRSFFWSASGPRDGLAERIAADRPKAGEAAAVGDELVPAAGGVAVEEPPGGQQLAALHAVLDNLPGVVGDASAAPVAVGDADEVCVEAHEEALGGESHG
jgi:hypothetical protein